MPSIFETIDIYHHHIHMTSMRKYRILLLLWFIIILFAILITITVKSYQLTH